jgi:para-nitrobenzyl esterase
MSIQATGAQPPAAEANPSADDLAANAWQLVKIMSMDDSVFEPQDASVYTLTFSAEGSVAIQADCNRAKGGWSSTRRGHVEFGPLAASRALCSPDSLSARYLSQFPYVRSYVIRNGHLFLATLADGAIIEFAPGVTASQTL